MLLQLPEHREAVQNEIRVHQKVSHPNVLSLVDSEIKNVSRGGNNSIEGIALLLFPYYRVSE